MTSLLSDQIKYLAVDLPVSIKLSRITKFFKIENAVIYRRKDRMYVYIFFVNIFLKLGSDLAWKILQHLR